MGIPASDLVIRRLALLADLLENDAVDLGFLGPNEGHRVISRHILESAALAPLLPRDGPIVDVGSGSGLPGLVLAAMGRRMVLIDSLAKRAEFLRVAAAALGADVDVRAARAEDEGRGSLRDSAPGVVARALASPPVSLELCLPFVRRGGLLAILASPSVGRSAGGSDGGPAARLDEPVCAGEGDPDHARDASAAAPDPTSLQDPAGGDSGRLPADTAGMRGDDALSAVARQLGGGDVRWQMLPVPGADPPRWVMMVDKRGPTPERFPRRPGVPKRRPLGGDVASVH